MGITFCGGVGTRVSWSVTDDGSTVFRTKAGPDFVQSISIHSGSMGCVQVLSCQLSHGWRFLSGYFVNLDRNSICTIAQVEDFAKSDE